MGDQVDNSLINGVVADEGGREESGRERLRRHRKEVAGRVWIPEIWGHEKQLLKDWSNCSAFDRSLFPEGLLLARQAMVEECRRPSSAAKVPST